MDYLISNLKEKDLIHLNRNFTLIGLIFKVMENRLGDFFYLL